MRVKIKQVNFTVNENWIFKLYDKDNLEYYILRDKFYDELKIKNPITIKELDYYDVGYILEVDFLISEGKRIVTYINK